MCGVGVLSFLKLHSGHIAQQLVHDLHCVAAAASEVVNMITATHYCALNC